MKAATASTAGAVTTSFTAAAVTILLMAAKAMTIFSAKQAMTPSTAKQAMMYLKVVKVMTPTFFSAKSEQDTIIDNQGHNSIRFHTDLSLNDLTVEVRNNEIGGYDWLIAVKNSNAVLTIKNQYTQNGTTPAISQFIIGTQKLDVNSFAKYFDISLTEHTESGKTINGSDGHDHLIGTSGDDIIDGKVGADIMEGGDGNRHLLR